MKSILYTDLSHLSIGGNVDIQRSDGRVHSAVVRSVDKKKLTVTVEWYENKETKGKEIDFGRIFELNPSINYNVIGSQTPFSEDSSLNFSDDIDAKTIITKSKSISRALPVLKNSGRNNRHISFNMIKLTNMSFSMVNSSFGWIKGNGYKSPLRHSSCVREEEKSLKNKSRLLPKSNTVEKNFDQLNPNFDFLKMIRDYQRSLNYSPLTSQDVVEKHQICVCVRKRPLNRKESIRNEIDVISIPNKQSVVVHEPKLKVDLTKYLDNQLFRFDYAFDENVDNTIVYRFTAKPLVECLFERGMATCFAYGQTGSGKTHTMGGEFQCKGIQNCSNGIYALAARDVFRLLNTKYRIENLYVECAFFEIYGGKVYDLLNKKDRLRILEDHRGKVQIVGLKSQIVDNVEEVLKIIHDGMVNRVSGQTFANQNSSRSHAVFQIILRKIIGKKLYGKFSLIDLAGNERGADTSSSNKITRMEGAEINKSLLALKECIRALGKKGTHRPFRASKLTQVLRDSFIGDQSQTCMISTISPGMQSYEHTLNTLRYADRVKELGPGGIDDNDAIQSSKFSIPVNIPGNQEFLKKINLEKPVLEATKINEERLKQLDVNSINVLEKKNEPNSNGDIEIIVEEVDDDEKTLQNDDIDITTPKNSEISCIADICYYIQNEKELIQQHSSLTEKLPKWLNEHNKLYKMTEYGEMNVSDYASNLGSIISDQINELIQFKAKVSNIRTRFQNVDSKRY